MVYKYAFRSGLNIHRFWFGQENTFGWSWRFDRMAGFLVYCPKALVRINIGRKENFGVFSFGIESPIITIQVKKEPSETLVWFGLLSKSPQGGGPIKFAAQKILYHRYVSAV